MHYPFTAQRQPYCPHNQSLHNAPHNSTSYVRDCGSTASARISSLRHLHGQPVLSAYASHNTGPNTPRLFQSMASSWLKRAPLLGGLGMLTAGGWYMAEVRWFGVHTCAFCTPPHRCTSHAHRLAPARMLPPASSGHQNQEPAWPTAPLQPPQLPPPAAHPHMLRNPAQPGMPQFSQ